MASRKIQLLRSTTVYNSRELAEASLSALFAQQANLADGEVVLARYKTTDEQENEIIKSVLGIYNSKLDMSGFTIVRDADEASSLLEALEDRVSDLESEMDGLDLSFNIDGKEDTNVPQESSDNSRIITSLAQENGQVYVGETSTKELLLTGYEKANTVGPITGNDTIESALNKLENNIEEVKPSIDETTIQMDSNDVLFSGLRLIQVNNEDITDPNVREQYVLGYQVGQNDPVPVSGDVIKVYKDSSLKEVYLGTQWDSVDSNDGTVKHVHYVVQDNMIFIDSETYQVISETDRSLYDASSRNVYTIKKETLTEEEYLNLDAEQRALYEYNASTNAYDIKYEYRIIHDDTYAKLTNLQKELYTQSVQNGYQIKEDKKYLSSEEYDAIFDGDTTAVYESLERIQQQTGKSDFWQSLNFVYILDDGTYQMVKVDVSKFLSENEFGLGLTVDDNGTVSVLLGAGLSYRASIGATDRRIHVNIDPTSDSALTVSQDGLKLDLTDITDNQLNSVTSGNNGITVSEKVDNNQSISLQLSETVKTNVTDAQYAGETVVEEVGGETIVTEVHNNILQIKEDGLYLDSTWDCGEY